MSTLGETNSSKNMYVYIYNLILAVRPVEHSWIQTWLAAQFLLSMSTPFYPKSVWLQCEMASSFGFAISNDCHTWPPTTVETKTHQPCCTRPSSKKRCRACSRGMGRNSCLVSLPLAQYYDGDSVRRLKENLKGKPAPILSLKSYSGMGRMSLFSRAATFTARLRVPPPHSHFGLVRDQKEMRQP